MQSRYGLGARGDNPDGCARTQAIYTGLDKECPTSSGGRDLVLSSTEVLVVGVTSLAERELLPSLRMWV